MIHLSAGNKKCWFMILANSFTWLCHIGLPVKLRLLRYKLATWGHLLLPPAFVSLHYACIFRQFPNPLLRLFLFHGGNARNLDQIENGAGRNKKKVKESWLERDVTANDVREMRVMVGGCSLGIHSIPCHTIRNDSIRFSGAYANIVSCSPLFVHCLHVFASRISCISFGIVMSCFRTSFP